MYMERDQFSVFIFNLNALTYPFILSIIETNGLITSSK